MQSECNIFHVYSCIQFFFISIYNDQTTRIIIYCPVKKANRFILITTEPIFIYKKKIKNVKFEFINIISTNSREWPHLSDKKIGLPITLLSQYIGFY